MNVTNLNLGVGWVATQRFLRHFYQLAQDKLNGYSGIWSEWTRSPY